MRKLIYILIVIVLSSLSLSAQQLPQYSQYMLNNFALNPAIAGTQPYFQACSDNRYQWLGITDAPRTYVLTLDGPITPEHMGIGASLFTDITGPTRQTGFSGAYSYHLKITDEVNIAMGISAGILQFAIDGSQITLDQPGDQALTNQRESVIVPDFGCGVYAYGTNIPYYFGIAVPQFIQSKLKLTSLASPQDELESNIYITGGYNFTLSDKFNLEPCMVFKYAYPVPLQLDLSARLFYLKEVWLGLGFRTADAAYAMVGYIYQDMLTFGFSYDYPITDIHDYSLGTMELFIGFKFDKSRARVTTKSQI